MKGLGTITITYIIKSNCSDYIKDSSGLSRRIPSRVFDKKYLYNSDHIDIILNDIKAMYDLNKKNIKEINVHHFESELSLSAIGKLHIKLIKHIIYECFNN